jgi:hypothetical protein
LDRPSLPQPACPTGLVRRARGFLVSQVLKAGSGAIAAVRPDSSDESEKSTLNSNPRNIDRRQS